VPDDVEHRVERRQRVDDAERLVDEVARGAELPEEVQSGDDQDQRHELHEHRRRIAAEQAAYAEPTNDLVVA